MAKCETDLSIKQVAQRLGLSSKTVLLLIKKGELQAYRPGLRSYRVTESALEAFRQRRRVMTS